MWDETERIRLLDCTLRDGGHNIQGNFGENVIRAIIDKLVKSNTEIIEAGFLWDSETNYDVARFTTIEKVRHYLPEDMGNSKLSLMADNVDISNLEEYDGTVEFIRLSFRKNEMDWAKKSALILKDKGYKCYFNPIHGSSITDYEYLKLIEEINKLDPYGFSIVDTFGAFRQRDLQRIYCLVENNLNKDAVIGVHLHENLGLAYSLAQFFLDHSAPTRKISVDGALFGMGKIPGNLCIEQIMDYLNQEYSKDYKLEPVYDAIDDYIMPIRERISWGYSIPYAISGQYRVHRTYAEFFAGKNRLRTSDLKTLMSRIDSNHSERFDKKYAEQLYSDYMNIEYDDSKDYDQLKAILNKYDSVLIIDPGSSIKNLVISEDNIKTKCIININFRYDKNSADFFFFTNAKRITECQSIDSEKLIITSNLASEHGDASYIISRGKLIIHDGIECDDSTLMLLNLLKRLGIEKVEIAGFDGFGKKAANFYEQSLERVLEEDDYHHEYRKKIFSSSYKEKMNITFLTPSVYAEDEQA